MRIFLFIVFLSLSFYVQAQKPGTTPQKGDKDFDKTQAPAVEYKTPDMDDILFTDEIVDTVAGGLQSNYSFEA
jgi:hypothetical protein